MGEQSTVPKKMATGTFTHSSWRTITIKSLVKTQRKVLKTSNSAYGMLLAQGQICGKNRAFYLPIGCVRLAMYCGKMYSRHLFPYGGFLPTPFSIVKSNLLIRLFLFVLEV